MQSISLTALTLSASLALALTGAASAQSSAVVGFDGGDASGFTGNFFFDVTGGNPDGTARIQLVTFFPSLRTGGVGEPVNAAFLGDYSTFDEVTLSMDVKVNSITNFFGGEIPRPFGIALVDRDIQGPSGPSGVFYELPVLSSTAQPDWTEFSVTIADTAATALPAGWIGFGDEDPMTFAPILPPGATFATVLAGVDEVRITGAVPGFFFTNATFDMLIDNVKIVGLAPSLGGEICTGVPNSTGLGADIWFSGSPMAAANNLTVHVDSLPQNSAGFGIHSIGTDIIQNPGGSQGNLCIGGAAIGRFDAQVQNSGMTGSVSFSPDLTALPLPGGLVAAMAGETRYF